MTLALFFSRWITDYYLHWVNVIWSDICHMNMYFLLVVMQVRFSLFEYLCKLSLYIKFSSLTFLVKSQTTDVSETMLNIDKKSQSFMQSTVKNTTTLWSNSTVHYSAFALHKWLYICTLKLKASQSSVKMVWSHLCTFKASKNSAKTVWSHLCLFKASQNSAKMLWKLPRGNH